MLFSDKKCRIILPVDKTKCSLDDGRLVLDSGLLPTVCPNCGGEGIKSRRLRISAPYDWHFWLPIGGLLGAPILFGLGAALVYLVLGNEALANYVPYGVAIAMIGVTVGGLTMSRSTRENWFLTFCFCQRCAEQNKKLIFISRLFGSGVLILWLIMLTLSVISSALKFTQETVQLVAYTLLIGALLLLTGYVANKIRVAAFRGLKARWRNGYMEIGITFKNIAVAEIVKSKLGSELSDVEAAHDDTTLEEEKDNDAIYLRLKQLALDDKSAVLETDSQEFRLLGRLTSLTQQKFLDQIEPYMTRERAAFVRRLRVDDGLTWRGIAEAWEKEFSSIADWDFRGNQLAGMALCELAAKMFAEDSMQPPWN